MTRTSCTYLLKGLVYTLQTVSFIWVSLDFSSAMVSNVGSCVTHCCVYFVGDELIYIDNLVCRAGGVVWNSAQFR